MSGLRTAQSNHHHDWIHCICGAFVDTLSKTMELFRLVNIKKINFIYIYSMRKGCSGLMIKAGILTPLLPPPPKVEGGYVFTPFCLSVCLLIAGILRISAIMLVSCVCHSVCLSVCLFVCVFVYPVAATPFQRSWPYWVQMSAMVQLRHLSFLVNLGQRSRSRSPKTEILIFTITSAKMVVSTSN